MTQRTLERVQIAGLILALALHLIVGLFASAYFKPGWSSWSSLARLDRRPNVMSALAVVVVGLCFGWLLLWLSHEVAIALREARPEVRSALSPGRWAAFALGALGLVEATFAATTLWPETYNRIRLSIWAAAFCLLIVGAVAARIFIGHVKDPLLRREWDRLFLGPPI